MIEDNSGREVSLVERKMILLQMLHDFTRYLDDNNITWYVGYGTLIGTIRHQGFIPWDDDIDINIPRKDFIRLIHLLKSSNPLKKKNIEIITSTPLAAEKDYYHRFKIADNRTYTKEKGCIRPGVFIDVFAMDAIHSSQEYYYKKKWIQRLSNICNLCNSNAIKETIRLKKILYRVMLLAFKTIGINKVLDYCEHKLIYNTEKNADGFYINTGYDYGIKDCIPVSCYKPKIERKVSVHALTRQA